MTSRRTLTAVAMLVVALGPASRLAHADDGPYSVQDAGPTNAVALGLTSAGLVVGAAGPSSSVAFKRAFGSGPELLAGLGSGGDRALGAHADGWAVGYSMLGFDRKPVRFGSGGAVELLPATTFGEARAVNAGGDIAGYMLTAGANVRAVVWTSSGLETMPSAGTATASAINDGRVVTGQMLVSGSAPAFRWTPGGSIQTLPTLGGSTGEGRGINNTGDVVGHSFRMSQTFTIATFWPADGGVVDLGTFGGLRSSAADINNHGQIVGYADDASGQRRAFVYDGDGIVDLNTLLEPGSGWVLLSANAINDAGQIAGEGLLDGQPRAFLLTPAVATDTTPPVISAVTTTPDSIWPPNHQMVDVRVSVSATDDSGETPVCRLTGITSSEPDNGIGDGATHDDAVIVGDLEARVRAERSGPAGVRVYRLAVECVDGSGNAASSHGTVVVGEKSASKGSTSNRR